MIGLSIIGILRRVVPNFRWKGRLLRLAVRLSPWQPIRSFYGPRLYGARSDRTYQFAITGGYGGGLHSAILMLPKDSIFLDIGANVGLYTILAARHLEGGRVVSLEPNPFSFRHLARNVRLHRLRNVSFFACGLLNGDWSVKRLTFDQHHTGKSSLRKPEGSGVDVLVGGPALLQALPISNPRKIFVKIDVEGSETEVLRALESWCCWSHVTDVFIEISRAHHDEGQVDWIYSFFRRWSFVPQHQVTEHGDQHFVRTGQRRE
jgi:FkbM family methyltransferase